MAGDPFRDAFRAELALVCAASSPVVDWTLADTINTGLNPDASAGYLELEFPGGFEESLTFGQPGANLWREGGQVTIRAVAPLGRDRNTAETFAEVIRSGFRNRRFAAGSTTVRIDATASMGGGQDDGGMWAEAIALSYSVLNTG